MVLSRTPSSSVRATCLCVTEKEYLLMKDIHLRKRLATFGLIVILLILTVCSIGATGIIWQATTQNREAVYMSNLDQQAHYYSRAEDGNLHEHILRPGSESPGAFRATAQNLIAFLQTLD